MDSCILKSYRTGKISQKIEFRSATNVRSRFLEESFVYDLEMITR